ncbi:uncharacterized protein METZ01_LOCUS38024 [marine metagenome]|uniref:DUF2914 domain-containing protein n=1 Tax=marine metagenome TaxID=408172 RepID=A0A381R117_9ZZZZ
MFDIALIFITIALAVLIFAAYKMHIPKAGAPLVVVYFLFLLFSWFSSNKQQQTKIPVKEPEFQPRPATPKLPPKTSNPIMSNVRPKPLVLPKTTPNRAKPKKMVPIKKPLVKEKQPTLNQPVHPYRTTMTVRDIQICKRIKNRNPVDTDNYFTNNVDTLFCYTRIQNTGGKQELAHLWYYDNQIVTTVRYNIKTSNIYRSWTRKTIFSHQIGTWRVDVLDSADVVIGSKSFYITDGRAN